MHQEAWKQDIEARDRLRNMILISQIANLMYPHLPMAKEREDRFQMDHPVFHAELAKRVNELTNG